MRASGQAPRRERSRAEALPSYSYACETKKCILHGTVLIWASEKWLRMVFWKKKVPESGVLSNWHVTFAVLSSLPNRKSVWEWCFEQSMCHFCCTVVTCDLQKCLRMEFWAIDVALLQYCCHLQLVKVPENDVLSNQCVTFAVLLSLGNRKSVWEWCFRH